MHGAYNIKQIPTDYIVYVTLSGLHLLHPLRPTSWSSGLSKGTNNQSASNEILPLITAIWNFAIEPIMN